MIEVERSLGLDELREIRKLRLSDVGFGRLQALYMGWHLRGTIGRSVYLIVPGLTPPSVVLDQFQRALPIPSV